MPWLDHLTEDPLRGDHECEEWVGERQRETEREREVNERRARSSAHRLNSTPIAGHMAGLRALKLDTHTLWKRIHRTLATS